jgi:acetylornithine deacetylase/succinyl-diaminopimelate desuccinylase-like protein
MFLNFDFEATSAGGHSSVPTRNNAIYDLAAALERLASLQMPARISLVTRLFFKQIGSLESGSLAAAMAAVGEDRASDAQLQRLSMGPRYNAQLRTTCVATRLEGGHADNALPQRARATVNCRLMPGEKPEFVLAQLQRVAGDRVAVRARGNVRVSEPSDPQSAAFRTIQRVSESMWPGVPVIPAMGAGATDGSRLRNAGIPTYGASGLFVEHAESRIHGSDERVGVRAFFDAAEYLYRLVKALGNSE